MSADVNFDKVVALLNFDSGITNLSPVMPPVTVTVNGTAATSLTQSKFGAASLTLPANGGYVKLDHPALAMGVQDFTVEMWIRLNTVTGAFWLYEGRNYTYSSGLSLCIISGSFRLYDLSTQVISYTPAIALTANTWTHVALVRKDNVATIYVNGAPSATATVRRDISSPTAYIGSDVTPTYYFDGFIDDVRITAGKARYTGIFTPPTSPHPTNSPQLSGIVKDTYGQYARRLVRAHRRSDGIVTGEVLSDPLYGTFSVPARDYSSHYVVVHDSDCWITYLGMNGTPSPDPATRDPLRSLVTLHLSMEGANNGTSFVDSLGNQVIAGTAVTSTADFKFGTSSAKLSYRTTDTLAVIATPPVLYFGYQDFTVELFFKCDMVIATPSVIFCHSGGGYSLSTTGLSLDIASDGTLRAAIAGYMCWTSGHPSLLDTNWHHVAITRLGSAITVYVDGVTRGTFAYSLSVDTPPGVFHIGSDTQRIGYGFIGYIDEFRVTKGACRYTSDFTVPTAAFPTLAPANVFYDMGGKQVSSYGDVNISSTASKFGGSSAEFQGLSGHIVIESNNDFKYLNKDFTIEMWVKTSNTNVTLLDCRPMQSTQAVLGSIGFTCGLSSAGYMSFAIPQDTGDPLRVGTTSLSTDTWTHVAWVRSNNVLTMYANGAVEYSGPLTVYIDQLDHLIGASNNGAGTYAKQFKGFIDDFRISCGVARYTGPFTAPLTALSAAPVSDDPLYSSVSVYLPMNGTDGGTDFSNPTNVAVVATNCTTVAATKKFGNASLRLPGNGYLTIPTGPNFNFGTGDFTIEMWLRFDNASQTQIIFDFRPLGTLGNYPTFYLANQKLVFYHQSDDFLVPSATVPSGTWVHAALVRYSGVTTLYQNGVSVAFATDPSDYGVSNSSRLNIGVGGYALSGLMTGNIDDLRISVGIARYRSNFTPPDSEFIYAPPTYTQHNAAAFDYQLPG